MLGVRRILSRFSFVFPFSWFSQSHQSALNKGCHEGASCIDSRSLRFGARRFFRCIARIVAVAMLSIGSQPVNAADTFIYRAEFGFSYFGLSPDGVCRSIFSAVSGSQAYWFHRRAE